MLCLWKNITKPLGKAQECPVALKKCSLTFIWRRPVLLKEQVLNPQYQSIYIYRSKVLKLEDTWKCCKSVLCMCKCWTSIPRSWSWTGTCGWWHWHWWCWCSWLCWLCRTTVASAHYKDASKTCKLTANICKTLPLKLIPWFILTPPPVDSVVVVVVVSLEVPQRKEQNGQDLISVPLVAPACSSRRSFMNFLGLMPRCLEAFRFDIDTNSFERWVEAVLQWKKFEKGENEMSSDKMCQHVEFPCFLWVL